MNRKIKTVIGIALFVLFLCAAYLTYTVLKDNYTPETAASTGENAEVSAEDDTSSQDKNTATTYPASDFTVYDKQGNIVELSDFIGKPIVLNFWASWCPPCKSEMPHFNDVYAQYGNDVVFIMVDMVDGQRETQAKGQKYVEEQGYTFPVYFDNDQLAADAYWITSIPTTLFIDVSGNIVKGYEGAISEDTLIAGIQLIQK